MKITIQHPEKQYPYLVGQVALTANVGRLADVLEFKKLKAQLYVHT